jgi:Gpi18-like mannosyltransferase
MQSTRALPAEPIESSAWRSALIAAALAAAVALVLFVVSGLAVALLPWSGQPHVAPPFTGHRWVEGWAQWDSGWYYRIARDGYSYVKGQQSTVVFFPVYPLLMRATAGAVGSTYLAGILVTVAAGVASAALFFTWVRKRLSPGAATAALLLFVLYPYAFFMFGAVYADAVFILAVIGAFVLLEHDHPWLAGLVGAVATACRPMGAVLVIGLAVRAWERRREASPSEETPQKTRRWRDAGVLVSVAGLAAFSVYLWSRFGDPLAFLTGQKEWDQQAGLHTWLKIQFFKDVTNFSSPLSWLTFVAHPVLTFTGLALVPRIFRRFGKGYGVYVLLLIGLSALSTKNFFGMSRYLLAAFPCFAVAGELVADRPRVRQAATAASGLGLVVLTAAFSRGYYLS